MGSEPIIFEKANRHGVADEDILHALRFEHHHFAQEDGMVMVIGPDLNGSLIEVGLIEWHGDVVVMHAFRPARTKYL